VRTVIVPAGEYQPDQPSFGNTGVTATNVIPWRNGYKPFNDLSVVSTALTARAQGFFSCRSNVGVTHNYAGDATKLYDYTAGTTFTDVTRLAGGAYACAVDEWWEFAQFGENVVACNIADTTQSVTIGGANFAALGGTPPKARHAGVVRDFLVLGNLDDSGTRYPNRVQWSAINNITSWTPSLSTQADYQDIPYGGWVQRIVGGDFGTILMDSAIVLMIYKGVPEIFEFRVIERNRGALSPQGVTWFGGLIFFVAEDGFYMMQAGQPAIPIGDGKIDKTFLNDLRADYKYRVFCELDPINKIFYTAYPGSGSSSGTPNKILAYNWVEKKWAGPIEVDVEMLCRFQSIGYTLEQLDSISADIETLTPSLDSRVWMGGAVNLAGFNTSHRLGTYTGAALSATVDTGEVELSSGRTTHVPFVRPLVDGNAASVAVKTRNRLADTATVGTAKAQSDSGMCTVRANSRYQSYRITTSGNFNFIQGVEVTAEPGGIAR
jgi:hypothetical protein